MIRPCFFISLLLGAFVTYAVGADDPRIAKTVVVDKINIAEGAVSANGVPGVGAMKNIFVSPDGARVALFVHTSEHPDHFAVWLDGKMGKDYDSVSEVQWDPRGALLYIGKRDGKAYVVRDGSENTTDVADDIAGLAPHPLEIRDFVAPAKIVVKDDDLPDLGMLAGEAPNPNAPIYGAKKDGLWTLHGDGALDGNNHWAKWFNTWPNGQFGTPSVAYEVGTSKGETGLMRDGKTLGPRSSWGLNRDFVPTWSGDGAHLVFCVRNDGKDYLCLDGNGIIDVGTYPTVHWSNDNHRFALFGRDFKTVIFSVDGAGKANVDVSSEWDTLEDSDNPFQTGVIWSKDGTHFAAFHKGKDQNTVWRDGKESEALPPVQLSKVEDLKGEAVAAEMNTVRVTPILSWSPNGKHLAVGDNANTENGLYVDGKLVGKAGAFTSITWTQDGEEPVVIARDDEFADIIPISTWSLRSGADTIDFVLSSEEKTDDPLTRVTSPAKGVYRVVMLERTANNQARIVRYDIKLGR